MRNMTRLEWAKPLARSGGPRWERVHIMIKGTKFADNVNVLSVPLYDGGYNGREGNDTLQGAAGDDTLFGGKGNDTVVGDAGSDFLKGDTGNDIIFGGGQADTIYGGEGNDFASGDAGADRVFGGKGDDSLFGSWGSDTIRGGIGNDILTGDGPYGDSSNDTGDILRGDAGNDTLSGGAGADLLVGGAGTDVMTGGLDADTFTWSLNDVKTATVQDTITDFHGGDILNLAAVLSYVTGDKLEAIRFTETQQGTMVAAAVGAQHAFLNVAFLSGAYELDLNHMFSNGDILV